jgi:hypothetical protein
MVSTSSTVPLRDCTPGRPEPTLRQTLAIVLSSYTIFLVVLRLAAGSLSLAGGDFGDNPSYLSAALAIRHWQFTGVSVKQFWGLPYFVAGLSLVTGLSARAALLVVCASASLVAVAVCHRLWGGWVALFFALLNLDWFQRALLGGAEPLFMALLLGAFLMLRRERTAVSAFLAALATIVRPFGLFVLIGIGVQLLRQNKFRQCVAATLIGVAVGAAYAWPLEHYLGSPLANVTMYRKNDWHGALPFSLPLVPIIRDTVPINSPLTNLALTLGWVGFVIAGLVFALKSGQWWRYGSKYQAEIVFVSLYTLALYTYNSPGWSRSNFPRFAIPILPWTLFFLRRFIPQERRVVALLAVVAPVLAAASAVGIRNVVGTLLGH